MNEVERREVWVELTDPPVRAGFRLLTEPVVAGTPVELEFILVWLPPSAAYLGVSTDRAAGRLADYEFAATASGHRLTDPAGDTEFVGGPATSVRIGPDEPFAQVISLEDYVVLADAPPGPVELRCRRRIGIAARQDAALSVDPVTVEVVLTFDLT